MTAAASPSPILITGGYSPEGVCGGRRAAIRQSFGPAGLGQGIGGGDLVARRRRAGLARCKGKLASPAASKMADFCGFRILDRDAVTIDPVTIGPKVADFRALRPSGRLIADYAAAAPLDVDRAQAPGSAATDFRGGRPPFGAAAGTTPLAHSAAGIGAKSRSGLDRPLLPMSALPKRANATRANGVGGRGAPALAQADRNKLENAGPGAGGRDERTLTARDGVAAAVDGAGFAVVQGGRPNGAKGTAMLCAPGLHVN